MVESKPPLTGPRSAGKTFWLEHPRAILAALALALVIAGGFLFYAQRANLVEEIHRGLASIAEQKANRLSTWFAERRGDIHLLGHDPFFGDVVARWLDSGGASGQASAAIEAHFSEMISNYSFDDIVLFDRQGNRKLAVGPKTATGPGDLEKVIGAANSGRVILSDFHVPAEGGGKVVLEFFVPVLAAGNGARKPVAVVLLRIFPDRFITPVLEERPVVALSTESLLVRRENEEVVILTDVRDSKVTALNLRFPIHRMELPAAAAARGIEGILEGTDYAGKRVVAALRAVPGSDWRLVVKMARDEAYAPIRRLAMAVSAMMLFVFATATWVVTLWWRFMTSRRALHDAEVALERQVLVKHFDYLSKYANDMIILFDDQLRIVEINDRVVETLQRSREELIGAPHSILRAPGHEKDAKDVQGQLASSDSALYETINRRKDGSTFPVEVSLRHIEVEGKVFYQGIARDITERRRVEKDLRLAVALIEDSPSVLFRWRAVAGWPAEYVSSNIRQFGYTSEELISGAVPYAAMVHPDDLARVADEVARYSAAGAQHFAQEYRIVTKDGAVRWLDGRTVVERDVAGNITHYQGIVVDITERKQATLALERRERYFRKLIEGSSDAFIVIDAAGREIFRSDSAERLTGYASSEMLGKPLTSHVHPDSLPHARSALAEILRRPGEPVRVELCFARRDGLLVDLEAAGRNLLHDPDVGGIVVTVRDVSERKKAEETQRQSSLKLNAVLTQTVQAIALSVERRDPLTAGHQQRVARLAEAIALEMGFAKDHAEGIWFAASIHDVGIGAIPAEIMNRPGPLDPYEFELVKSHARTGFDIVKDIDFPWPVARMILQHHERLDGSGYPDGLNGEAILPEARIIAVADVVEAMCSHRPYRPALGVDAALEEIARNRGKLYGPSAVDACIRLFRQMGFTFAREADVARPAASERTPRTADEVA